MTIVSDDTVSKALQYLASDPHPLAAAQTALLFAKKTTAEAYAQIYLASDGTKDERNSRVMLDAVYKAAQTAEIEADAEVGRHRRRTEAAERILDIWRTEQSNIRAAEKIR